MSAGQKKYKVTSVTAFIKNRIIVQLFYRVHVDFAGIDIHIICNMYFNVFTYRNYLSIEKNM